MARNEEKQQGRLNRLWLQRQREEGRVRDVPERRPKLVTLSSAASVKKWIPSIKSEIEYYLQQSQLSHYPERKIVEFQLHIDALQREYKSFIAKLRALEPSCKHKPWTPRAYCKRRAETQEPEGAVKALRCSESQQDIGPWTGSERQRSEMVCQDQEQDPVQNQDQPLCFDQTRLSVATAAFRGRSVQSGSSETQNLARVLQAGLPNLTSSAPGPGLSAAKKTPEEQPSTPSTETPGHFLGLDCYSSSDEDSDT